MKLLALLSSPAGTRPEQFAPFVAAEANRLWELYCAGLVEEVHFCQPEDPAGPRAMLLLRAGSRADAAGLLASLPLVKAGLLAAELIALAPMAPLAAALARHHLPLPAWWADETAPAAASA